MLENLKYRVKFFLEHRYVGWFDSLHVYKRDKESGCSYVIPYGKSKLVQFLYIYNPKKIISSAYKPRFYLSVVKFNCGWITYEEHLNQQKLLEEKGYKMFKIDLFRKIQYYFW